MSELNNLDKEINKLEETTKNSLQILEKSFDRYNDLVSKLITAMDVNVLYADVNELKRHVLHILKKSLDEQ